MHSIDGFEIVHRLCWKACKMASLTKRRGEGRSCKPSSKVCVHRKAPEMGANRFASLRSEKVRRVKVLDRKFCFEEKDIQKNDWRGEKY